MGVRARARGDWRWRSRRWAPARASRRSTSEAASSPPVSAPRLDLHARGRHVICYFDAGTWEKWRPDASSFPPAVLGKKIRFWPEERELDIRNQDVLRPIMGARMDLAVAKGCDSVSPDNMERYLDPGRFKPTYLDQLTYNIWIANEAHARGLTVGLRNDEAQGAMLASYFDWPLTEGCISNGSCDDLDRFAVAGKAVFGIEYELDPAAFCPIANAKNFDFQQKHVLLDAWRVACR